MVKGVVGGGGSGNGNGEEEGEEGSGAREYSGLEATDLPDSDNGVGLLSIAVQLEIKGF